MCLLADCKLQFKINAVYNTLLNCMVISMILVFTGQLTMGLLYNKSSYCPPLKGNVTQRVYQGVYSYLNSFNLFCYEYACIDTERRHNYIETKYCFSWFNCSIWWCTLKQLTFNQKVPWFLSRLYRRRMQHWKRHILGQRGSQRRMTHQLPHRWFLQHRQR